MERDGKRPHHPQSPGVFFQVLRDCGALRVLFPEIDALFGVPAPARWHPEIDTGIHTLMTLSMAAMLSPQVDVRFATLCHDLGKGLTPPELWPRHHGHGPAGVKLVEQLCQRLRVPNEIRDLARLVAEFHDLIHTFPMLNPKPSSNYLIPSTPGVNRSVSSNWR